MELEKEIEWKLINDSYGAGKCPVCRRQFSILAVTSLSTQQLVMEKLNSIYGGVYIQGGQEGLASYHFDEKESYISYATAPPTWKLDNGNPPPLKKYFKCAEYHPEIRTFRAIVDWSDVNFQGDALWVYRTVFSEDFMKIESGEVLSYNAGGDQKSWYTYKHHLRYARMIKETDFSA